MKGDDEAPGPTRADDPLAAAFRAAEESPGDDARWDELETLAAAAQRADDVMAHYRRALSSAPPAELASRLGERAVRFHDAWMGDPAGLSDLLASVLAAAPDAQWAFQRLSLLLTSAGRWQEMLALYDRALARAQDDARRADLLSEATHIARDLAGQNDRAVGYLKELLALRPNDARVAAALERLLERLYRHRDLVKLWTARLPLLPHDAAQALRARIAECLLIRLDEPAAALAATEGLLAADPTDASAVPLLERALALPAAPADVRRRALALLRQRYDAAGLADDAARVIATALEFGGPEERADTHRVLAARLAERGRDAEALAHCESLVLLDPSREARELLRDLAARAGRPERYPVALAAAADAATDRATRDALLVEAARARRADLGDAGGAADLYARVLAEPGAAPDTALAVARSLDEIYAAGPAGDPRRADVLELLAELEPDDARRRAALGSAAAVSAALGDVDRALAAWRRRLDADSGDVEALDATVDLLDAAGRWEPLAAALRRRASAAGNNPARRRADLVRVARVQSERLGAHDAAVKTLTDAIERHGRDPETVDALADLLEGAGRWPELVKLLEKTSANEKNHARKARLLARLGDAHRTHGAQPERAASSYQSALKADPANDAARAGMLALFDAGAAAPQSVDALARAYAATDDWSGLVAILEHRLAAAKDDAARAAVLLESAESLEARGADPAGALSLAGRAFALARPGAKSESRAEREVLRLAEATGRWAEAAGAYRRAALADPSDLARVARLRAREGALLEDRAGDDAAALEAYTAVLGADPAHPDAAAASVRVASRLARWADATRAVARACAALGRAEPELLAALESAAGEDRAAWDALAPALEVAVREEPRLAPPAARDLEARAGAWHRDRRDDPAAAEAALLRAVAREPSDPDVLRALAALQRRAPSPALVDTLLRLAGAAGEDPDVLHEAAAAALAGHADPARARDILARLVDAASARRGEWSPRLGGESGAHVAAWAVESLAGLHERAGEHAHVAEILAGGARLAFDPEVSRRMRHRAAEAAAGPLADPARAASLYREALDADPADARAIERLAELYAALGRDADLLALRRHELSLAPQTERRLALRLDAARLLDAAGDVEGLLAALRENLADEPGHAPTVAEAARALRASDRLEELFELFSEQASRLADAGRERDAASLWERAASVAERDLSDPARALDAHRRAAALAGSRESLAALARLHVARGEHAAAVEWLERLASMAPPAERAPAVARLASALAAAGERSRAVASLEAALAEDPAASAARAQLAALYRDAGAWTPLARVLAEGALLEESAGPRASLLREAAAVYAARLGDAPTAVRLLEEAAALAPADRGVRAALAAALRDAGRPEEARPMLERLVLEFGRQRTPERAAAHYQLALIARARGDNDGALEQLELAAGMDVSHPGILQLLGDLSRDTGRLDRAERAYSALLLVARRGAAAGAPSGPAPSAVLFELYKLAAALGQSDRAAELLESAFESAGESAGGAPDFERALRDGGHHELLLRALRERLARAAGSPDAESALLSEIADVLAGPLDRPADALDARLGALARAPGSSAAHDAARALAHRAGATRRYADLAARLAEGAAARNEAALAAEIYLRLGRVFEEDLADPAGAAAHYLAAERTGERAVEAWRGLDRALGAAGDSAGQARALRLIAEASESEAGADAQTDALYRLAAIELAAPETVGPGADALAWALDREPQYERAAAALRAARPAGGTEAERVASLYERVARALGDGAMLLDAIERRASLPGATADALREGVEVADVLGDAPRAESLLRTAAGIARASGDAASGVWAMTALAERRRAAGDPAGAVQWLREAADAADDANDVVALSLQVGELAAGPLDDLRLAARTYERLLERDPAERAAWEPLLGVYRRLGETARLESLLAAAVDAVFDSAERNRLRMERAEILLGDPARADEAASALRAVLDEDPDHGAAARALAGLLEGLGRTDDLADLLTRTLDAARDRGDGAEVTALALRLGALLEPSRRQDAIDVYRSALDAAPTSLDLARALVRAHRPEDDPGARALALESLLALETGPAAADLGMEAATAREAAGDIPEVAAALERGARACPERDDVRERLERWYESREEWEALADLAEWEASWRKDRRAAAARLRFAAGLRRERRGDPAGAARLLRAARDASPDDAAIVTELARALADAGQHRAAVDEVTAALEHRAHRPQTRAELLRLRAEVRAPAGEGAEAVDDLGQAFAIGGKPFAKDLVAGVEQERARAASRNDRPRARAMTLRLAEVLTQTGEAPRARDVLVEWLRDDAGDHLALRALADADAAAGRWEDAAESLGRLVALVHGEARAEAALGLAEACDRLGRPAGAREGLERAYRETPGDARVRARLRALYRDAGETAALAGVALADAEHAADDAGRFERLREAGELFLAAGRADDAVAPLERALALRPTDHDATVALADAYLGASRLEEAVKLLTAAVATHKGRRTRESSVVQHRMSRAAAAAGDDDSRLQWLAASLDSNKQNGEAASELAELAMALGRHDVALRALGALTLMKDPKPMSRAEAYLRQGLIADAQGDPRKAAFWAKKALSEDPRLEPAAEFLKNLASR